MKHAVLVLALVSASASAFAADTPATAAKGACAAPTIPGVSTSQVGADRVKTSLKEWDACLSRTPGTDAALVAKVAGQAKDWAAATEAYWRGQANGQTLAAQNDREQRKHQDNVRVDQRSQHPQSAQDPF